MVSSKHFKGYNFAIDYYFPKKIGKSTISNSYLRLIKGTNWSIILETDLQIQIKKTRISLWKVATFCFVCLGTDLLSLVFWSYVTQDLTIATMHQESFLSGPKLVCFDLIKQSFSCLGGVKDQSCYQDSYCRSGSIISALEKCSSSVPIRKVPWKLLTHNPQLEQQIC